MLFVGYRGHQFYILAFNWSKRATPGLHKRWQVQQHVDGRIPPQWSLLLVMFASFCLGKPIDLAFIEVLHLMAKQTTSEHLAHGWKMSITSFCAMWIDIGSKSLQRIVISQWFSSRSNHSRESRIDLHSGIIAIAAFPSQQRVSYPALDAIKGLCYKCYWFSCSCCHGTSAVMSHPKFQGNMAGTYGNQLHSPMLLACNVTERWHNALQSWEPRSTDGLRWTWIQ